MEIYVAHNNKKLGPLSLEVIQATLDAGKFDRAELAWYEGAPGWIPLAQVPGIKMQGGVPPPLPPMHPAQPQFAANSSTHVDVQNASQVGCLPSLGAICLCGFLLFFLSWFLIAAGLADAAFPIMGGIVIVTSCWVYFDARAIGVEHGQMKGIANIGPTGWLICCLGLWGLAFPIYLVARPEFKRLNGRA